LQKMLESAGANFSQHLRERRLARAHADLESPLEAQRSISEIAYRYGFSDSAHFSRVFRQRFGLAPRDFRREALENASPKSANPGRRGWPSEALARRPSASAPSSPKPLVAPSPPARANARQHHLSVDASTVHWGYFSRALKPVIEIASGDTVVIETLSQHASDDVDLMIAGDEGAESVFGWTREAKNVDRRGAGPMDASIFGRGAGEGFGVHICTGPIAMKGAEPGDVLEVRILDIAPRPSHDGRVYGSSVAAWWGYHYGDLLDEAPPREIVTIYDVDFETGYASARYAYRWTPTTDPFGVVHATYDYPGVPVNTPLARRRLALEGVRVPLRPHFGVIATAPRETGTIDSVPPAYFGGNFDNWRLGRGATVYLPVSAPGALLSVGDPHAAQGDGEVAGTAIECSLTGTFEVILHKQADLRNKPFEDLTYPLIETPGEWVLTGYSHPNYLAEFGAEAQSEVYAKSSLDLAMKDAFRKARRFLMNAAGLSEDEAIALMSAAVDFGVTQVVDGNWGVHAIISKRLFVPREHG
jgi:acetamidase/formamidase